jgi:hypothetical protein
MSQARRPIEALMQDPEVVQLMSQPGVMGPLQEVMSNPQVGVPKHMDNVPVMKAFMAIQEKMQALSAAPPPLLEGVSSVL